MFSNSDAYQAEIRYRRQQLGRDLARRQRIKQAKLARRSRKDTAKAPVRRPPGDAADIRARSATADRAGRRPGPGPEVA